MAAAPIAMSTFPADVAPTQTRPGNSRGTSPSLSPSPSTHDRVPMKSLTLKDYEDLTYREMIESSSTVFSAIKENELLQRAFSELLNGPDVIQDITTLLNNCKSSGFLGIRRDQLTSGVENTLSKLSTYSIPHRVRESQAIQLSCEAMLAFPSEIVSKVIKLNGEQRKRLLQQFQKTPIGSYKHSFVDKGAWTDPDLQPILKEAGYKLYHNYLHLHRESYPKKDYVRAATMAVLAIDEICTR